MFCRCSGECWIRAAGWRSAGEERVGCHATLSPGEHIGSGICPGQLSGVKGSGGRNVAAPEHDHGGAIQLAGNVRAKGERRRARSDG
jgi:hypothetical protein